MYMFKKTYILYSIVCIFFEIFGVHTNEGFNSEIDQTAAEPEHMRFCYFFKYGDM